MFQKRRTILRKQILFVLKILISGILIWYLLSKIQVVQIYDAIKSASLLWILMAFMLNFLGKIISGIRWKYLLAVQGTHVPMKVLISSLLVGHFFNNFLPSTIGGDTFRAYDVAKYSNKNMQSVITVVAERMMGILALATLALLAVIFGFWFIKGVDAFFWLVSGFFSVIMIGFITTTNQYFVDKVVKLFGKLRLNKISQKVKEAYDVYKYMKSKRNILWIVFIISVILQINVVIHYYLISISLNLGVPILYFFIIIPIVLCVLLLPISINGIGLRENTYVFLMGLVGVSGQKAVAFSWLAFGLIVLMGIIGGIVFIIRR